MNQVAQPVLHLGRPVLARLDRYGNAVNIGKRHPAHLEATCDGAQRELAGVFFAA